jgi:hypothetical protein
MERRQPPLTPGRAASGSASFIGFTPRPGERVLEAHRIKERQPHSPQVSGGCNRARRCRANTPFSPLRFIQVAPGVPGEHPLERQGGARRQRSL